MINLKTKKVEIDGVAFEVKELTPRVVLPLMEGEPDNLAIEIAKLSVHVNGKPIGEPILDMGFGAFNKLINAVTEINGLGDQGND